MIHHVIPNANVMRLAALIHVVCVPAVQDGYLLPGVCNFDALHAAFFLADAEQIHEFGRPSYGETWMYGYEPVFVQGLHLTALIRQSATEGEVPAWSPYRLSIDVDMLEALGSHHDRMSMRVSLQDELSEVDITTLGQVIARLQSHKNPLDLVRRSRLFGPGPEGPAKYMPGVVIPQSQALPPGMDEGDVGVRLHGMMHSHY